MATCFFKMLIISRTCTPRQKKNKKMVGGIQKPRAVCINRMKVNTFWIAIVNIL